MKVLLAQLFKMVFTPKMKKQMFMTLGDWCVKSTKAKLDDSIWAKVKDRI